jgi:hypothetical protein
MRLRPRAGFSPAPRSRAESGMQAIYLASARSSPRSSRVGRKPSDPFLSVLAGRGSRSAQPRNNGPLWPPHVGHARMFSYSPMPPLRSYPSAAGWSALACKAERRCGVTVRDGDADVVETPYVRREIDPPDSRGAGWRADRGPLRGADWRFSTRSRYSAVNSTGRPACWGENDPAWFGWSTGSDPPADALMLIQRLRLGRRPGVRPAPSRSRLAEECPGGFLAARP